MAAATAEQYSLPDVDSQRRRLKEFRKHIERMATDGEDSSLREMSESSSVDLILETLREEKDAPGGSPNYDRLLQRLERLRSLDEDSAPRFLETAAENGNEDALAVCLFVLPTATLQARAADTLASCATAASVRCLTIGLTQALSVGSGGYEQHLEREKLRKSLVNALGVAAAIDVSGYDGSEKAGLDVLRKAGKPK